MEDSDDKEWPQIDACGVDGQNNGEVPVRSTQNEERGLLHLESFRHDLQMPMVDTHSHPTRYRCWYSKCYTYNILIRSYSYTKYAGTIGRRSVWLRMDGGASTVLEVSR